MTPRNPITALLLTAVLPVAYAIYWLAQTGKELQAKGADVPPWWYLLVPILGIVHIWKVCQGGEQTTGSTSAGTLMVLMVFFMPIGVYVAQKNLNGGALQAARAH